MPVDIIIPVWNLPETTRECVESLKRNTDYPYRLIVIDNASGRETAGYLEGLKGDFPEILLIRNSSNLGFVKAVNQGIAASTSEYVCVLNNDTILTEGWLGELVDILEADPSIGIINPSSNTSGQFPGAMSIDDYARTLKVHRGQTQELYTCRGFCMLIRRGVIKALGPLDEVYQIGYFDDTDYCKRVQAIGYRTARSKASYVYHKENKSFAMLKDNDELFRKNEELFFSRWGRHVRVGYFVDALESGLKEKVDRIATDVARNGHQIIIFLKKGLAWPVGLDHFDIRRQDVNPFFFGWVSVYKVLKRKKKKRLEVLLTDSRLFGRVLKRLSFLHEAEVVIDPKGEAVLGLLREKSKVRS